jgi:hypothetical protein
MPPSRRHVEPRTYFLNESHELAPVEKGGGGRPAQYDGISWAAKARKISHSLEAVVKAVKASADPLKDDRYFVIAAPVSEVKKRSKDKKKAPHGTYKEPTDFGGDHGKVFDRLGLDLLQVTDDGRAIVHAERERLEQLVQRSASLDDLGAREQARWATIDAFDTIPLQLRVDADWLKALHQSDPSDVVIELQPVLTRVESDRVLRAVADLLVQRPGEKLTGSGTDFSGRHWFRGKATQRSVRELARDYFSVQAIHSPLYSIAAAKVAARAPSPANVPVTPPPPDPASLPCVAVVDLGVPSDHKRLAPYRRGQFIPQDTARPPIGDHGSLVASRVVFGDHDTDTALSLSAGRCAYYDAMVGDFPSGPGRSNRVNDKAVMPALLGVRGASPDVRVFNLSFGDTRPLAEFPVVEQREKRLLLQDLDNFVFANDSLVVVAAGNSQPGVVPNPTYPHQHSDKRWALGPWACGFNTLVCGSYVSRVSASGLVQSVGWPSPFARIGPGLCDAPVPSFSAPGGNTNDAFNSPAGLGVWGYSAAGLAEDSAGTSFAAPILAREAAITLHELARFCMPGTQPFAVTARAFLALTARPPVDDERVRSLVERTLGHGSASIDRLITPKAGSAVILWQGIIESPKDTVRVQLPIPLDWMDQAKKPMLRLVICYDPPVNEVAHSTWACRKVKTVLHLGPEATYLRAPRGDHATYPEASRLYSLGKYKPGTDKAAEGDMWLLELSYDDIAPYPPAMDFDPRQRVAFAAELFDVAEEPVDPQGAMQALPAAQSMIRLSVQPAAVRLPLIVRTRT